MPEQSEHIFSILKVLPSSAGVYQYFDAEGQILYVGKAKNLRSRVSSYFTKQRFESAKTALLVKKIADIKYMVVESEVDALLLENSLIKKYKPRYNILLKDDKTYPSIVIKKAPFPRIFPTRQIIKDGSEYHGPYASVKSMHAVLDLVKKLYPIRTCSLNLTKENIEAKKFKVCLEYHIGNCLGPCEGKQSAEDYENNIENIRRIIKGNYGDVLRELKKQLAELSKNYRFEEAHLLKNKIELIENFQARSTIVNPKIHNVEVFTIVSDASSAYFNFLRVNSGVIVQGYSGELKKKMDESDRELLEFAIINTRERFQSTAAEVYIPFNIS
ncbi:MAG: excinuclease ABC subunit C, partial [Crocinitomicaceae bacterium]|nr:excinuclease ABC subunit C [Crocinitomicaceae bacterium]